MLIDAHTHGMHGGYTDAIIAAGGKWAKTEMEGYLVKAKRRPMLNSVPLRIQQMDKHGCDIQVVTPQWKFDANLSPDNTATQLAYAQAMNDNMARVQEESKGRLFSIGTVPLADYEKYGRKEAERAIKKLGLKGLFLSTNHHYKPIDLPEYEPFWAHMNETGCPVIIHPGDAADPKSRPYENEYDMMHNFGWPYETQLTLARLVFSGIMEKYQNLQVVSHHLGGGLPFVFGRTAETYNPDDQQRQIGKKLPKPLFDYFQRFYYDTAIGGNALAVKLVYDLFGVDRVVYATDAPYGPGDGEYRLATYPQAIKALKLPEADNKKIFETNARKIFKI